MTRVYLRNRDDWGGEPGGNDPSCDDGVPFIARAMGNCACAGGGCHT